MDEIFGKHTPVTNLDVIGGVPGLTTSPIVGVPMMVPDS